MEENLEEYSDDPLTVELKGDVAQKLRCYLDNLEFDITKKSFVSNATLTAIENPKDITGGEKPYE